MVVDVGVEIGGRWVQMGGGGGCSGYRGTGWWRWDTGHGLEIGRAGGWR